MKIRALVLTAALLMSANASAEMEMFKDYELSDSVISMTTVKVDAGKGEDYLEGLKQTWVASNQVAKDLGQLEDFHIYVSQLPESGDFNVVLIISLKSLADFGPSKAKYDAFMKKWSEKRVERNKAIAKTYPELREITGEYLLSEVEFK